MERHPRTLIPDYIRLFALFGIVIVNIQMMGFSALDGSYLPVENTFANHAALWLVIAVALGKSYALFCFVFGAGFGLLMRSAERSNLNFGNLYRNRIIGLAMLGILHGTLFFHGDVLFIYAVMGAILFLVRDWPTKHLARLGAFLLVVSFIVAEPISYMYWGALTETDRLFTLEKAVMTSGGFWGRCLFQNHDAGC